MMFKIPMSVRDYECDMQGIVNNAVYQNYLEHARHEFLGLRGKSFSALLQEGIHVVLVCMEIDYKQSLHSGDQFEVSVVIKQHSPLRLLFAQTITRKDTVVVDAKAYVALRNEEGKLQHTDSLFQLLSQSISQS